MTWQDVFRWEPRQRPSVAITGGSQYVREEKPPEDWTPPAPVGFAPPTTTEKTGGAHRSMDGDDHTRTPEPLTWEGDQS
jgi:hypothetical protein